MFHLFRRRRAPGFTLVELLVVIAIITILMMLLIPAVNEARKTMRRLSCKNNLRQIGVAVMNHEQAQGHFPTGGWGWDWVGDPDRGFSRHQPGGWAYNILPYMEQTPLHQLGADSKPNEITQQQLDGAREVQRTPLAMFYCPSRRQPGIYPTKKQYLANNSASNPSNDMNAARSDYAMNCGDQENNEFFSGPSLDAIRPFLANSDSWSGWNTDKVRQLSGIAYERSEIRRGGIIDGLSNTYLAGEKYLNPDNYYNGQDASDNETWCTGYNNDNYRNAWELPRMDTPGFSSSRRWGSAHPVTFNMLMCDGSVHSVNYNIALEIHRKLANRRDGDDQSINIEDL